MVYMCDGVYGIYIMVCMVYISNGVYGVYM